MVNTDTVVDLAASCDSLYPCFGKRADTLFDFTDAILTVRPQPSPAHLSLEAVHRRGWGSLYGARPWGVVDARSLRELLVRRSLPGEPVRVYSSSSRGPYGRPVRVYSSIAVSRRVATPRPAPNAGTTSTRRVTPRGNRHPLLRVPGPDMPVEVAGRRCLHPVADGAQHGHGPAPSLGPAAAGGATDAVLGPARLFRALACARHPSGHTETLRPFAWTPQRSPLQARGPSPFDQEGRLTPPTTPEVAGSRCALRLSRDSPRLDRILST